MRWVTPDIHRVHHTNQIWEQPRNPGEIFPWWDRLFGTYSSLSSGGEAAWEPGLAGMKRPRMVEVGFLLKELLDTPPPLQAWVYKRGCTQVSTGDSKWGRTAPS